jgi:hypothetical protein
MLFISGGNDVVGVGSEGDLGVGLHIRSADSGASVATDSDELVIEGSGASGLSILSGNTSNGKIAFNDDGGNSRGAVIYEHNGDNLRFQTAGADKLKIDSSGHLLPGSDDAQDLGSASLQFRDIYTGDLNLNNTRHRANEVDGTSGSWTIQEGDDNLYILNRLNGKKYKFKLEEIE